MVINATNFPFLGTEAAWYGMWCYEEGDCILEDDFLFCRMLITTANSYSVDDDI